MLKEFTDFSKSIHLFAKERADFVLQNWDKIMSSKNPTLNKELTDIFDDVSLIEDKMLNALRLRKTTIKSAIFEIFIGSFIKKIFEQKYSALEIILDASIKIYPQKEKGFSVYPDIQIYIGNKLLGIVELKLNLKLNQYHSEVKRRKKILALYPNLFFSHLAFGIYDKSITEKIITDNCDWLYVMNFRQNAEKYINDNKIKYSADSIDTLILDLDKFLKTVA